MGNGRRDKLDGDEGRLEKRWKKTEGRKRVKGRVEIEERKTADLEGKKDRVGKEEKGKVGNGKWGESGTGGKMSGELEGRRKKSVGRSMRRVKITIGRKM